MRPADKVAKALLLETKMTGNANFPTPDPTLVDLKTGREKLEVAMVAAANGDHVRIFERNVAEVELDQLIVRLAMYVSNVAQGDPLIILSSGFDLRKEASPIGPLPAPRICAPIPAHRRERWICIGSPNTARTTTKCT